MPIGERLNALSRAARDDDERVSVRMPDGTVVRNVPRGTPKPEIERKWKEAKLKEQVSKNPIAGPITSFMGGVSDMMTFGFGDEISAGMESINPFSENSLWRGGSYNENLKRQQARDKQLARDNPKYNLAGQVVGAVAPVIATGGGSAVVQAPKAATGGLLSGAARAAKPTAAAAAQGGAYAFGSGEGGILDRAKEVPEGAAWGAVGDIGGRALGATAARLLGGPKLSKAQRALVDEDILLTPGMRGGRVKKMIEDQALGSIPYVDSIPEAARNRSFASLRKAVANRVLKPLGRNVDEIPDLASDSEVTRKFADKLNDVVYSAYDDALENATIIQDPKLNQGLDDLVKSAALDLTDDEMAVVMRNVDHIREKMTKGPLGGRALRETIQTVRERAAKAKGTGRGGALSALNDVLEDAIADQNGAAAGEALKSARKSVALLKRFNDASSRAGSEAGAFGPTQLKQAAQKKGYGTSADSIARGGAPLLDLADNAAEVMRIQSANSGTVPRAGAMAGLLGGPALAGTVDPTMGAILASQTLGYVPGVDRVLQNMATRRPAGLLSASEAIRRQSRLLGGLGTGTALGVYGQ